jgi:hypothetical protein
MANYLPRRIDMTGQRFGRLLVIKHSYTRHYQNGGAAPYWQCRCDCGAKTIVARANLMNKSVVSCGCKQKEDRIKQGKKNKTHGETYRTGETEYHSWQSMRQRCNNPNYHSYNGWGGRGIKICKRWGRFENFLADMGRRPKGTTLDRINSDGDYKPSNCRWATKHEQRHNRTRFAKCR